MPVPKSTALGEVVSHSVPTRFIKVSRGKAATICAALLEKMKSKDDGKDVVPFQAVPNERTDEVFIIGTTADMDLAEKTIHELDQAAQEK